jgi:hypothetical protein
MERDAWRVHGVVGFVASSAGGITRGNPGDPSWLENHHISFVETSDRYVCYSEV